jgi:alkenylglycerophosphocholine/alkenylglycerophosphoethanolamine hydrolase
MTYLPILIVLILAILNWIAAERKLKPLEYVTKPATMLALLWWMWSSVGLGGSMLWFTLGAVFCLAGDVFLMIPRDMFIFGLLAFLLGHICYTVGFNDLAPFINLWGLVLILILGIYLWWLYPKITAGLVAKGKNELKIPILIYSLVISMMVYSALMTWTRSGWSTSAAICASLGAILFFTSDSVLAWDRFVNPLSHARLQVMMTYHLGQFGIILGAILHATIK